MEIKEEWKIIENYPNYMISNFGRVKNLGNGKTWNKKERILKQEIGVGGYIRVGLYKDKKQRHFKIHRLVATHFIPNPNNYPCINHIDENKQNNNVNNLEWCDIKYNNSYGTRMNKIINKNSLPIVQYSKDEKILKLWRCAKVASNELKINYVHIHECCRGTRKLCGGFKWKKLKDIQLLNTTLPIATRIDKVLLKKAS